MNGCGADHAAYCWYLEVMPFPCRTVCVRVDFAIVLGRVASIERVLAQDIVVKLDGLWSVEAVHDLAESD